MPLLLDKRVRTYGFVSIRGALQREVEAGSYPECEFCPSVPFLHMRCPRTRERFFLPDSVCRIGALYSEIDADWRDFRDYLRDRCRSRHGRMVMNTGRRRS
ncbi:hypothetical protein [Rhodoligotrophos defluvii]|jgi:hypothetical protein|uniref:hypothetical protein n=1 Tax=Rhodoligotrophos defluvii TaxID=2561934 RepID=UPI0010C9E5B2|nr:hypothetical protein [Rhodoligotrophos defluvii]